MMRRWIIPTRSWVLLAALLGINRLFVTDAEQGGFDAFLLAPVDRTALYVAKAAGPNAIRTFVPAMRDSAERQKRMLADARRALEQDRVFPFYQPKVCLRTGKLLVAPKDTPVMVVSAQQLERLEQAGLAPLRN